MRDVPMDGTGKGGVVLLCAALLAVFAAYTWADGAAPQTEVYNALADTPGTPGFWDKTGYSGSLNSVGMVDCAALSIGAGAASEAPVSAYASYFEFFGAYSLESAARGLDSREPRGMIILAR